ncbi:MAG TPA: bifunctional riboflavin kinase/FAD synthetase [Anaerolineales bacterium]|nr:bifunctional riboflavin kinase/FAD synthetase [Anaerolineales bacterium]
MQHFWSLDDVQLQHSWLTIGAFDGVHRGHQQIVAKLIAGAHAVGSPAVVITFFPHPAVVLGKRERPFYLTSPEQRADLLGMLGADVVITHPFDKQVAATSAYDFMANLDAHLNLDHLLVGEDFALGHNREGNVPTLRRMGEEQFGYTLEVMPPVENGGEKISSSQIRRALEHGDVERAANLLGRPFRVSGEVIHGDGRGRTLGIPTANLDVWADLCLPEPGIYVCRAHLRGQTWGAVTNVGYRPTFEPLPETPVVEAYILDFDRQIYGEKLGLDFLAHLREEIRFSSVQALVEQMHADVITARQMLTEQEGSGS